MCIICAKPKGAAMPSIATLKTCWTGNSDGAGIAYVRPGDRAVNIVKGFMKLKHLLLALESFDFTINDEVIVHYRFATHGLADAGNCHPFPLSRKIADLRAVDGEFPCVVAHNGVFGNMPCHETLSDTQKFISGVLCSPAIINNIEDTGVQELISGYCGSSSKLALLKQEGMILIGHFMKEEGVYYSNNGYKSFAYGKGWSNEHVPADKTACILCEETKNVTFYDEEDCFLCDKCLDFNLKEGSVRYYD